MSVVLVRDIITEMKSWACFRKDKVKQNNSILSSLLESSKPFKPGKAESSKKKKMQKESRP